MHGVLEFGLLGVGSGAVYALLADGIVLIYKGSGVIAFSNGAIGMFASYLFYELRDSWSWPSYAAFIVAVGSMIALGIVFSQYVMRPLQKQSVLARLVATLALLTGLQSLAVVIWGPNIQLVASPLPSTVVTIWGIRLPQDRLWLMGIAIIVTIVLWAGFRFTKLGLATRANSEKQLAAATFGWSPDLLSAANWGLGSGLAAVAGILIAPLAGLDSTTLTLIVIDALAVALAAGFSSFPVALGVGTAIGIGETEAVHFLPAQGVAQAIAFVVIAIILVVKGTGLPIRSHIFERLPELGLGKIKPRLVVIGTAIVVVLELFVLPTNWVVGIMTTMALAIMLLSSIVVTGFTGQLSLAQFTLGGVAAMIASELAVHYHWPFEIVMLLGVIGSIVAGVAVALPALRTRGVSLAIITLAIGLAVSDVIFENNSVVNSSGINVGPQHFFGINVDPIFQAPRYAVLCTILFVVLALAAANLRRSRAGRRLIAVRGNERAAASLGISVLGAKVYGFAMGAGIAGVSGVLIAFMSYTVLLSEFNPLQSITSIVFVVLGGIGYVIGALVGGLIGPGGLITTVLVNVPVLSWVSKNPALFAGVGVIFILLQNPNGIANQWAKGRPDIILRTLIKIGTKILSPAIQLARGATQRVAERLPQRKQSESTALSDSSPDLQKRAHRVAVASLDAANITVRFGGLVAVGDVSIGVHTGEVVALIGPNGAGKSTLLDTLSGFISPWHGSVSFNGQNIDRLPVHRRARAGIGRSFQSLELFEDITLRENLLAASEKRDWLAYVTSLVRPGNASLSDVSLAVLDDFDLVRDLENCPKEMSNGRRHLVAIARAVATGPSILLLDEPVSGLDDVESRALGVLVRALAEEWGMGIVVVEHDMSFVMEVADRVVVLDFGTKIAEGTPAEIRSDPKVIAAYLGSVDEEGVFGDGRLAPLAGTHVEGLGGSA